MFERKKFKRSGGVMVSFFCLDGGWEVKKKQLNEGVRVMEEKLGRKESMKRRGKRGCVLHSRQVKGGAGNAF